MTIIQRPSPNHSARPNGTKPDAIVMHADAGSSEEGTLSWITHPQSAVSYHYLIGRDGTVYQCVQDARKAWHAGKSTFGGRANCNDYTIGVSFANRQNGEAITAAQWTAAVRLVHSLCKTHGIPVERITTHKLVALPVGRKSDPEGPDNSWFNLVAFRVAVATA